MLKSEMSKHFVQAQKLYKDETNKLVKEESPSKVLPGPGSYQVDGYYQSLEKGTKVIGSFGSLQDRFKAPKPKQPTT